MKNISAIYGLDNLPSPFDKMTFRQILNDPETTIIKKGNLVKVRRPVDGGMIAFEYCISETGRREINESTPTSQRLKRDYHSEIKDMYARGYTSSQIASELCISQSYVIKIIQGKIR